VRKDAKIALIVILSLMVLVVVIWGRSPRPDDSLATPKTQPQGATAADPEVIATAKSDTPDATPTPHDSSATPADRASPLPTDAAMINHPDASRTRPAPDAAPRDSLPTGRTSTPADSTPSGPTPAPTPALTHTVASGDTLIKLAVKYYRDQSKWRLIQQANRGVSVLRVGQKLTIPPAPDATPRAVDGVPPTTRPAPTPAGGPAPAPTTPDRTPRPAPNPGRSKTYTVQKGDTFMKIARSVYRDPGKWRTLYERNRAKLPDPAKPDSLRPGTIIEVPALASTQ